MTETHKRQRYDHKADAENDEEYNGSALAGRKKDAAPQGRSRF